MKNKRIEYLRKYNMRKELCQEVEGKFFDIYITNRWRLGVLYWAYIK